MKRFWIVAFALIGLNCLQGATPISSLSETTNPSSNTWVHVSDMDEPSAKDRKLRISNLATPSLRDGNTYIVTGVIRNTGSGWDVLDGLTHTNLNITSIEQDETTIYVNYAESTKVISAFVQEDDAYATNGICFRTGSVTETQIEIVPYVNRTLGGYFRYNGSTWDVYGDTSAITFNAGNVQVWHSTKALWSTNYFGVSVNCRAGTYVAGLDDMAQNYFNVKFVDHGGSLVTTADTSMRCYWLRRDWGQLDPEDLTLALGNIWIFAVMGR